MPMIHACRDVVLTVRHQLDEDTTARVTVAAKEGEELHHLIERVCELFNAKFDAGLTYHKVGLAVTETKLVGMEWPSPQSPAELSLTASSASCVSSASSSAPSTPRTPMGACRRMSLMRQLSSSIEHPSVTPSSSASSLASLKKANAMTTRDMYTANGTGRLVTPEVKVGICKSIIRKVKGMRLPGILRKDQAEFSHGAELAVPEEYRNSIAFATRHPLASLPYVRWCTAHAHAVQYTLVPIQAPSLLQRRMLSSEPLSIATTNLRSAPKGKQAGRAPLPR